jgi:hypothetical protein
MHKLHSVVSLVETFTCRIARDNASINQSIDQSIGTSQITFTQIVTITTHSFTVNSTESQADVKLWKKEVPEHSLHFPLSQSFPQLQRACREVPERRSGSI